RHLHRALAARACPVLRHRPRDLVALEAGPEDGAQGGRPAYPRCMSKALFIVDVQNDFTEGGALGVEGGDAVAAAITRYVAEHAGDYEIIVASRDWHDAEGGNGGHFAEGEPDFVDTWPPHCVAGTEGAEYDPNLDVSAVTHHVKKG